MAQTDQQQQQQVQIHFRWIGSNTPIASHHALNLRRSSRAILQCWLAPKLGMPQVSNWNQVTLYFGAQRMTHDVLLGAHLWGSAYPLSRQIFMPHIDEAWHSFVEQTENATKDLVVHVTRCSDDDLAAAESLLSNQLSFCHWFLLQQNAGANNLWNKYKNNVAFMINATLHWNVLGSTSAAIKQPELCVYGAAPAAMQQHEKFALATIRSDRGLAQLLSSELWNKPSFAVQAAWANELGNFCEYLGPNVKKDAKTMLRLIQHRACYFKVAAAKNEFEFQCLAASANHKILRYLDNHAIKRVAKELPDHDHVQQWLRSRNSEYAQ